MKVALLSPFFWPEPISTGKYNTILAEALIDEDCDIDVYCSHPIYPQWKPIEQTDNHPKLNIKRGGLWMKYSKNQVVKRFSLEIWYLFFILSQLLRNNTKYDQVISVFPPVFFGFLSALLLTKNGLHTVISHDIQGILAEKEERLFRKLVAKAIWNIEKIVYKKADHIIFLSESMRVFCVKNYEIDISKTSIKYPFEDISNVAITDELQYLEDGQNRIVYSGALGEKQAPDKIIKLFETIISKSPDFKCYIFSCGPTYEKLKVSNNNSNIIFNDLVPLKNLKELLVKSKLQLIPQEVGTADAVLPSKLPNIICSGSGVVAITDRGNELELLLKNVANSYVFYNWDYEVISNSIIEHFGMGRINNEKSDDAYFPSLFDVNVLAKEIKSGVLQNG